MKKRIVMTIEEKAKAYDVAKIRCSQLWESDPITRENYEYVFPELKDGEDERIKGLIYLSIEKGMGIPSVEDRKKALSWLEKQGEQKPQRIISAEAKEAIYGKPAWSEEDERIKQDIENLIHFVLRDGSAVSPAADTTKEDAISWIQSLKDRVQPQKDRVQPQNLNVTDEELIKARNEAYNDALDKLEYHCDTPTFNDGWSAAIWYLKKRNAQPQTTWKPSDEQMEYLSAAIEESNENPVLKSLYKDLKKLREE